MLRLDQGSRVVRPRGQIFWSPSRGKIRDAAFLSILQGEHVGLLCRPRLKGVARADHTLLLVLPGFTVWPGETKAHHTDSTEYPLYCCLSGVEGGATHNLCLFSQPLLR